MLIVVSRTFALIASKTIRNGITGLGIQGRTRIWARIGQRCREFFGSDEEFRRLIGVFEGVKGCQGKQILLLVEGQKSGRGRQGFELGSGHDMDVRGGCRTRQKAIQSVIDLVVSYIKGSGQDVFREGVKI